MNRHAAAAEEACLAWAEGFGLFRDSRSYKIFKAGGIGRLAAMCRPFCGREDLMLLSIFYAWMFLQDDLRDESEVGRSPGRLSEGDRRSLDVLEGDDPAHSDGPVVHAMGDLRERFASVAPGPLWMRRFTRAIRNYLDATIWEASNRARGIVPDPESYLRMRPLTGGLDIDEELIGLSDDARLPRHVLDDPSVKRLTRASMNVVCWSNDILSLEKELAHGDVHNLVIVLRDATGLPLEEAMGRVIEMHNAEVRDFIALAPDLPSFGGAVDANLSRYVSILQARMRGNLDWSLESGRYAQAAARYPSADGLTAGQPPVG
jgi:5-epi-alpha-selinene synthase